MENFIKKLQEQLDNMTEEAKDNEYDKHYKNSDELEER